MLVALRRSLDGRLLLQPSLRCRACARPMHIHIAPRKPAIAQLDVNEDITSLQSTVQPTLQDGETIPKSETSRPSKSKIVNAALARQLTSSQKLRSKEKQSSAKSESKSKLGKGKAGHEHKANQQTKLTATSGKKPKDAHHAASTSHQEPSAKNSSPEIEEPASKEDILATATRLDSPYKWDEKGVRSLYSIPPEDQFPSVLHKHSSVSKSDKVLDWKADPMHFLQDGLKVNCKREVAILNKGSSKLSPSYRVRLTVNYCKEACKAVGDGPSQAIALKTAAYHLIMKDFESLPLKNALIVALHKPLSQEVIAQHRSSKVDVYDYAAQFDTVPHFETTRVPANYQYSAKLGYFSRVTVKGTSIVGEGYHTNAPGFAEIAACMNFKTRAEELHQGEKMMVKHINTLTSQTGQKFLEYCKMKQRDWAQYNCITKIRGHEVSAQLYLGDKLLSECVMYSKTDAEAICYYLAARDMKKQDERVWKNFVVYIHEHAGEILKPVPPVGVWTNLETIGALRNRVHRLMELDRELEAFSRVQQSLSDEVDSELETLRNKDEPRRTYSEASMQMKNVRLKSRLEQYENSPDLEEMRKTRSQLPLNQYQEDVKALFNNNDVCVLVGATGSGKTTQVPQLILDQYIREGRGAECNIICTQPRRIAAMSVAKRVAAERGEQLRQSVGYHVRFGYQGPEWHGSITYCTTGILLRQLREGWESLKGVTHVIVDEVHERDVQIDFLMVLLKRILEARRREEQDAPPIKVILMSATIDTTLFREYFGAAFDNGECPFIEIPGRLYPVEKFFLDDIQAMLHQYPGVKSAFQADPATSKYLEKENDDRKDINKVMQLEEEEAEETGIDWSRTGSAWEQEDLDFKEDATDQPDLMIATTIAHLCSKKGDGAVLVFLPGIREIVALDNIMKSRTFLGEDFTDSSKYRIFMLHSSIPTMQQDVFLPLGEGVRKIILSTNIAETSVTIPEVAFVVDTCKHREKRYSQLRRSTALVCTWISQSSARQRAGRAGRVKAGEYYSLIYSERHSLLPIGENAEIKRSDLQSICLDVRSYGIKEPIADVLEECIEPPSSLAVITALKALRNLGALDDKENLTPLGSVLAQLPVAPALGKMVLLGTLFKCLDPILILAAIESSRNFFVSPPGTLERSNEIRYGMALGNPSDHLALLNAYREWRFIKHSRGRIAANEYAFDNLMHVGGLQSIEKTSEQMLEMLVEWDLVKDIDDSLRYNNELGDPELNVNADVHPLIFALLTAGLMPNIGIQVGPILLQTSADPKAMIHPSSLNSNAGEQKQRKKDKFLGAGPPGTLVVYSSKSAAGGGVFLRETSVIGPITGIMFNGNLQPSPESPNVTVLDDWLPFKFESGVAPLMKQLTNCVDNFLNRTWARLKVLKARKHGRKSAGDGVSFYESDPSRDPVVRSVVEILERAEHLESTRRKMEMAEFSAKRAKMLGEPGTYK